MSSSTTFTSAGFSVESVVQSGPATIRVIFTQYPKALNPGDSNDGLNPSLYTITGPGDVVVTLVATVLSDPQALDLTLSQILTPGMWTLWVGPIVSTEATPLQSPNSASFEVQAIYDLPEVSDGAESDSPESVIRKHLPVSFKGKGWESLISALAIGDKLNWDNAKKAFDQLFKISASGKYLDRKAADSGISRPKGVGINDELFRRLAIKATSKKLIHQVILEVLEVFYGSDSVRAFVESELVEPYSLQDGDELDVFLDENELVKIVFSSNDFARPSQATAIEVASAINRFFNINQMPARATTFLDSVTGKNKVRIYSGSLGLSSSIRVLGGRAQTVFVFPEKIPTSPSTATPSSINWNVTSLGNNIFKWQLSGSVPVDLSLVQTDDYMCVFGSSVDPLNRGTFTIKDVVTQLSGSILQQYILIENPQGVAQNFTQSTLFDVLFFRPIKKTSQSLSGRDVIVSQTSPQNLDIVIPATTQAVTRNSEIAAYPSQRDDLDISSVKVFGNTVTVNSTNHGLSAGDQILVEKAGGALGLPITHPATVGYTDASTASHWFELNSYPIPPTMNGGLVSLGNKALIISGAYYNDITEIDEVVQDCSLLEFTGSSTLSDGSIKYAYSQNAVASISTARMLMTASAFANNAKVLVTGGINDSYINESAFLSSTEIYDLASNTWSSGPSLPSVMVNHTHTLLNDGKVLISGGASTVNKARSECQLFDPTLNTITPTGSMLVPRVNHRAVKLNNGKVLVIGGRPLGRESAVEGRTLALWRLDDSGSTAVDAGPNGYTLTASGSTTANVSGKINKCRTFSGGHLANSTTSATAVSALQGEWTVEMWLNRENASGVGTVISFGGATSASNDNRLLDIYVSMTTAGFTCTWENGSGNAVTMSSSANGWFGGWCNLAVVKKQNLTNPSTYDLFVYVNGILRSTFLAQDNCSGGNNGYWYIGKSSKVGTAFAGKIDDVRVSSYAKSEGEILQNFRRGCGSLSYPFWGSYGECLASCEIYDPSTSTWVQTGSMSDARSEHTATLLPDGKVLVTGGVGYSAAGTIYASQNLGGINTLELKTCEIYDPTSGTWSPAGSMSISKWGHSAEYISSKNQVIIPFQEGYSGQSDIFDVKTKKWKRAIALPNDNWVYNYNSNSVVLDNGIVFIAGGPDWVFTTTPQWMYIPAKDFISSENINGLQTVLSVTTNEFTYQTDSISANQNYGSDVSIVAAKALSGVNSGPYILTPNQGVAITSIQSTITSALNKGQQYNILPVADASVFPDSEGWLWIGYGEENGFGPIKYLGRNNNTSLLMDFSYRIPKTNPIGTSVTLLVDSSPFNSDGNPHPAYVTGSSVGRVAAQNQIESMVAAGINTNFYIKYPGDKGLGNAGLPTTGNKTSDKIRVWAGDDVDAEVAEAEGE